MADLPRGAVGRDAMKATGTQRLGRQSTGDGLRRETGSRGGWSAPETQAAVSVFLLHTVTCVHDGKEQARAQGNQNCHVQGAAPALVHGDRCGYGG
jgi:hypothetical protein